MAHCSTAAARPLVSPLGGRLFPAPPHLPPPRPSLLGFLGSFPLWWRARTPPPRRLRARTKPMTPTPTTRRKRRTTRRRRNRTLRSKRRNLRRARLPPFREEGNRRRLRRPFAACHRGARAFRAFRAFRPPVSSTAVSPRRGRGASLSFSNARRRRRLPVSRAPAAVSGSGVRSRSSARRARARRRLAKTCLRALGRREPREGAGRRSPPESRRSRSRACCVSCGWRATRPSPARTVPMMPTFRLEPLSRAAKASPRRPPSHPRRRRSRLATARPGAWSPPPSRLRWA